MLVPVTGSGSGFHDFCRSQFDNRSPLLWLLLLLQPVR
jgi:hypothetical protein